MSFFFLIKNYYHFFFFKCYFLFFIYLGQLKVFNLLMFLWKCFFLITYFLVLVQMKRILIYSIISENNMNMDINLNILIIKDNKILVKRNERCAAFWIKPIWMVPRKKLSIVSGRICIFLSGLDSEMVPERARAGKLISSTLGVPVTLI